MQIISRWFPLSIDNMQSMRNVSKDIWIALSNSATTPCPVNSCWLG